MKSFIGVLAALICWAALTQAGAEEPHFAKIETSLGDIIIEFDREAAPIAVENFLQYATSGHYDRTLFHRVVPGYVVQGGGYSILYTERTPREPIPYEGDNGLKNNRTAVAMARGQKPDSAQAQWFINLRDNEKLNHRVTDLGPIYGYTVFAHVVDGMAVVDAIGAVPTGPAGPFDGEVPLEQILIKRVDPVDWPPSE